MTSYDEQRRNVDCLLSKPETAREGSLLDIPRKELLPEILEYIHFNGFVARSIEDGTKTLLMKW